MSWITTQKVKSNEYAVLEIHYVEQLSNLIGRQNFRILPGMPFLQKEEH